MISFKGRRFPKAIILMAVRWKVAYALSYRNIEELMAERGVTVDHATIQRWVRHYAPLLEKELRKRKRPTGRSWRMDETYIKVNGQWVYLYRAVDKDGDTLDFQLSKKRDLKAASRFFQKTIESSGWPQKVTIDKSGSNTAALNALNTLALWMGWWEHFIEVRRIKYLNNRIEQDHRAIKRITRPMLGFKSFESAQATIAGIELHYMLRKGQAPSLAYLPVWQQFYALAT